MSEQGDDAPLVRRWEGNATELELSARAIARLICVGTLVMSGMNEFDVKALWGCFLIVLLIVGVALGAATVKWLVG